MKFEKLVLQLAANQRIERREGLIHQQDVGVGGEGARQTDALLHAPRELRDMPVGPLRQSHQLELFADDLLAPRVRLAAQLQAETDVVAHRAPRQQTKLLEHHRHALAPQLAHSQRIAGGNVDRGFAVPDQHAAPRHGIQAVGGPQQGRLAGTRQPHQHRYLATLDLQIGARNAHDHAVLVLNLGARFTRIESRERFALGAASIAPFARK